MNIFILYKVLKQIYLHAEHDTENVEIVQN